VAEWPTHEEVLQLLRLPDASSDDDVVEWARLAGIDYCVGRIDPNYWSGADPGTAPVADAIHQAALFMCARFYRRRDSLDGTIGWGEMGVVRVGIQDPDAERLLARFLPVVIG
jgi:hypothetical protein